MDEQLAVRDVADGCTLAVRVHPGAKLNAIGGMHAGALRVSITAPATDGRANDALIAFVAGRLDVPRARVTLLAGAAGRSKTLRIQGKSAAEVQAALVEIC